MVNRTGAALAIPMVASLLTAGGANAAFYEFTFSGVIVSISGTPLAPFDAVITGDAWEFRAVVDTLAPTSAIPAFYGAPAGTHYDAVIKAGLSVGVVNIPFGPLPPGFEGSTLVSNDTLGMDILGMFAHVEGVMQVGIAMFDNEMAALTDESIPTTLSSDWDPDQSALGINFGETLGGGDGLILGVVLESSVREVPSPGAAALLAAAGLVVARRRRD